MIQIRSNNSACKFSESNIPLVMSFANVEQHYYNLGFIRDLVQLSFVVFKSCQKPSVIIDYDQRPDFAIVKGDMMPLLKLAVGFETNIVKNFNRKAKFYEQVLEKIFRIYKDYYVNLSLRAIDVIW